MVNKNTELNTKKCFQVIKNNLKLLLTVNNKQNLLFVHF